MVFYEGETPSNSPEERRKKKNKLKSIDIYFILKQSLAAQCATKERELGKELYLTFVKTCPT